MSLNLITEKSTQSKIGLSN